MKNQYEILCKNIKTNQLPVALSAQVPVEHLQLLAGAVVQQAENAADGAGLKLAVPEKAAGVGADLGPQAPAPRLPLGAKLVLKVQVQLPDPDLPVGALLPLDVVQVPPLRGTAEVVVPFKQKVEAVFLPAGGHPGHCGPRFARGCTGTGIPGEHSSDFDVREYVVVHPADSALFGIFHEIVKGFMV